MPQRRKTKRAPAKKRTTKATTRRRKTTKKAQASYRNNFIGGILAALALLGFLNLGFLGTLVANGIRLIVGEAYLPALVLLGALGLALAFTGQMPKLKRRFIIGGAVIFVGAVLWLSANHFALGDQHAAFSTVTWHALTQDFAAGSLNGAVGGGMVGAWLLVGTAFLISIPGSEALAVLIMLAGVIVFFNVPVVKIGQQTTAWTKQFGQWLKQSSQQAKEAVIDRRESMQKTQSPVVKTPEKAPLVAPEEKPLATPIAEKKPTITTDDAVHITVAADQMKRDAEQPSEPTPSFETAEAADDADYQLPSPTLLSPVKQTDQTDEYNAIDQNTAILKQTLDSFGVDATVKNVSLGPAVTEYELHPAIGVKVSRIVNLADDLALALAAKDIRIEAPIPGKSLIGIEVPNKTVSTVAFRDVIEGRKHDAKNLLEVPLGRDVAGHIRSMDLTKMPHLLIAGSTGSGKSVMINGIITSLLMNARPSQLKLMLIDPKKVELSVYNGIPHLLTPVVSEPKKAAKALHKAVAEMERRYELFSQVGQRKISGYNAWVQEENQKDDQARPTLPYIVVVVDELADLMMTVSSEVEDAIIRLAQMGRAAGVHMILATQRPSVDVITGLIKANVPSRIAFAVSSGIDSRTILDSNGAEKLLGRGDMLYLPIDANTPVRVQGAFISDSDVESVVNFIQEQMPAEYDESMVVTDEEVADNGDSADSDDELFDEVLAFVVDQQKASTSMIQRRFRIGYNRAARLIDDLEQRGYIGPQDGSRPRDVYKQPEDRPEDRID